MNSKKSVVWSFACVAGALSIAPAASAQYVERTIETVRTTDVQVLTSGPVHEAFAETVVYDPEPDVVVLLPPPEPLNEEPPDVVPEGPDMTWIPGYWVWDDDRDDYLWISGIWRSVPPGRSYVPGFWTRVGHGYQWSSGFWIDSDTTDLEYLPDPPEPIDSPPPPSPSPNLIWTPGIWVWDMDRYVWRPGHWVEASPDWIWMPAHYVWSPRGYIFVDGYWDFTIGQRGVLFAPVYVTPVVRQSPAFVYSPQLVIDLDIFTDHLFVSPRYRHYYFGDYYAASYVDRGIYPWFTVQARRVAYDPIYVHRHWRHRNEPDWERDVEVSYNRRRDDERERPPRVYQSPIELGDRGKAVVAGFAVAKTLQQMAQANRSRYRQIQGDERNTLTLGAKTSQKAREERKVTETVETGGAEPVKRTTPTRAKMPTPTATSKKGAPSSKGPAPKKPDAPTADRNVAPKAKAPVKKVTRQPKPEASPAEPARPATPAQPTRPAPTMQPSPRPAPPPAPGPKPVPKPQPPSTPEGKSKKDKDKDKDKDDKDKKKDD